MLYTESLVLPLPYSSRVTTTSSHPQLRDLLTFTPTSSPLSNRVSVATFDSIGSHSLYNDERPLYTPLGFSPCCVTSGCGFVAVGGQNDEIAITSVEPDQTWCHQYIPHRQSSWTRTSPGTGRGGSIVNSLTIASPSSSLGPHPRLLASSNDHAIRVFDIVGNLPDYKATTNFRKRHHQNFGTYFSETPSSSSSSSSFLEQVDSEDEAQEAEMIEPNTSSNLGGTCTLLARPELDLTNLPTPINHCSVSPNEKHLVAVGDTDEIFLFRVKPGREGYELRDVIPGGGGGGGRRDASFTTDWDRDGNCFVVGSQDGFVTIYDIRQLPTTTTAGGGGGGSSRSKRTVAEFRTSQTGSPAGAVRKIKFCPGGRGKLDGALLAFTEHRNRIQVVDSRNYESTQILEIPSSSSTSASTYSRLLLEHHRRRRAGRPYAQVEELNLGGRRGWENFRVLPSLGEGGGGGGGEEDGDFLLRNRPRPGRLFGSIRRRTRTDRRGGGGGGTLSDERDLDSQISGEGRDEAGRNRNSRWTRNAAEDDDVEITAWREGRERHDRHRSALSGTATGGGSQSAHGRSRRMELPDEGRGQVWPTAIEEEEADSPESEMDGEDNGIGDTESEEGSDEDEDADEDESSINTTRPRRFSASAPSTATSIPTTASQDVRQRPTYSSIAATSTNADSRVTATTTTTSRSNQHDNMPYTTLSRYSTSPSATFSAAAPLPPTSLSIFAAPLLDPGRSSTPPVLGQAPRRNYPFAAGQHPPGPAYFGPSSSSNPYSLSAASYSYPSPSSSSFVAADQTNYFPVDQSPFDLLGMDWDEFGERLLVATGKRVWEWDVDVRARRGRGVYEFR